ncbi:iron-containing alcohol dehydrogenase [Burkholderia ambifaria IOP40-10]|uniref:Iron-containing alcohol dehydrogenase n=1 Tax=Burkholderia ambifaria IOP40-10 TaxID=396596 RepID=B1FH54_9BURK|nr:phosphonoacetaldehyde reductase [Burkholderia ambifaria]EDT03138.1 iron-containing alcohol dehydrogenase [Burkholderia ambifaria IOP40-10]
MCVHFSLVFPGAATHVPQLTRELAARRVAVFRGPHSFDLSNAQALLHLGAMRCDRIDYVVADASPTLESIAMAGAFFAESGADAILAIGGGAVIDTAKGVRRIAACPHLSAADALRMRGVSSHRLPACIAVPTTAGTGSEVTPFATFYVDGIKHSVDHPDVVPDRAVVDARLTGSLDAHQSACTGIDAICHGIESMWSRAATPKSLAYASDALTLCGRYLGDAIRVGNTDARAAVMHAAHLAGRAIAITRTTAAHALSYALTARFGIPHGHAVGLFMGPVLAEHARAVHRGDGIAQYQEAILTRLALPNAHSPRQRWEAQLHEWGLPATLEEASIPRAAYAQLVAAVNLERLANHPVRLDLQHLLEAL